MIAARRCWLMKSEPDAFSIDDLARDRRAPWDGVRNFSARNNMRAMTRGDLVLFYHSNANPPGVIGVARVCREAYPDRTALDPDSPYFDAKASPEQPRWSMVDVEFVEKLPRMVTLHELKADPAFSDMVLTQRSRLSVQPVEPKHFDAIVERGGGGTRFKAD